MTRKTGKLILRQGLILLLGMYVMVTGQKMHACDANDELPGALPPAPNGGELGEAKRVDEKSNLAVVKANVGESRLYWEGVHLKAEKKIRLTLVQVLPPKVAVFTVLSPEQEFSALRINVESPREQMFVSVPFSVLKDEVIVSFDAKDLNRFIIHIEGNHLGIPKKAMVQIEEE